MDFIKKPFSNILKESGLRVCMIGIIFSISQANETNQLKPIFCS